MGSSLKIEERLGAEGCPNPSVVRSVEEKKPITISTTFFPGDSPRKVAESSALSFHSQIKPYYSSREICVFAEEIINVWQKILEDFKEKDSKRR